MSDRRWLDPAEGWRWGFPRLYDPDVETLDPVEWMKSFGVPHVNIMYCRGWDAKDDETNSN